jgi:flavin reductase (DIM6/NTAB) family NADH-FMN oxidoreductase RutF
MTSPPDVALAGRALDVLRAGVPAVLITVGEDGWGHAAMTWIVAVAPNRARFGVDHSTRTSANLERTGKVALEVIAQDDIILLLKGSARMVRARIEAAPFAMSMWELSLTELRDQRFSGVVVQPLRFEWTGARASEMQAVERAILAEMREWPG